MLTRDRPAQDLTHGAPCIWTGPVVQTGPGLRASCPLSAGRPPHCLEEPLRACSMASRREANGPMGTPRKPRAGGLLSATRPEASQFWAPTPQSALSLAQGEQRQRGATQLRPICSSQCFISSSIPYSIKWKMAHLSLVLMITTVFNRPLKSQGPATSHQDLT